MSRKRRIAGKVAGGLAGATAAHLVNSKVIAIGGIPAVILAGMAGVAVGDIIEEAARRRKKDSR